MDPNERLKAVLTLIHEIAKLEKAGNVSGDLSPADSVRANREEVGRLKAKLRFLLSGQLWPTRSRM